jgi:hypothetical protein
MTSKLAIGAAALIFIATPALAATGAAQQEAATARAHALMAAGADSLKMTHAHLHHVINCLVGPKGAGYDASAADPCKGMGEGAIPDASHDPRLHRNLSRAVHAAEAGLRTTDLKQAQRDATRAADALKPRAAQKAPS